MVDKTDNERAPLLGATGETSSESTFTPTTTQPLNNSDNLINFSTENRDGRSYTACKVCDSQIDITEKTDTFVVKCLKCNEATVTNKRAPAKKRYVRCTCNCLLICCETANRIVCPRADCKKIIDLPVKKRRAIEEDLYGPRLQPQLRNNSPLQPCNDFQSYVVCVNCSIRFPFDVLRNRLATCPSCRRVSSVGDGYANIQGVKFLIIFVLLVVAAIITSMLAKEASFKFGFAIFLFLMSIYYLYLSIYYFTLKVSELSTNFQSA